MRSVIRTSERLIEAPAVEPLEFAQVKKNLRFSPTSEDGLIFGWVVAARQYFEQDTSRQVITALWEYGLECAPCGRVIELPHPPLLEVVEVLYTDGDGVEQVLSTDDYTVDAASVDGVVTDSFCRRGRVQLAASSSWPTMASQMNALRIRYSAGYGSTVDDVPDSIQAALYDIVRHFHMRPGDTEMPMTTQTILRMFRQSAIDTIPLERAWLGTWP